LEVREESKELAPHEFSGFAAWAAQEVASKRKKSRETIRGVHVPFQNVKREIVKATKRPHGEEQQGSDPKCRALKD
jgi:hypothetical protein